MAESKSVLARLSKLERDVGELKGAVVQITHILVEQSERTDAGFQSLRGEMRELRQELRGEMHELRDSLGQRLDRLIAVTIQERTEGADRLANIERRLTRLEDAEKRRSE